MAEGINDPSNLASLSTIVNKDKIDKNVNIEAAEEGEMKRSTVINAMDETDPEKAFNEFINELKQTGVDIDEPQTDETPPHQPELDNKFNNEPVNNFTATGNDDFAAHRSPPMYDTATDIGKYAGTERPPDLPATQQPNQNNYGTNIFGGEYVNNVMPNYRDTSGMPSITRTPQEQDELLMDRILQGDKDDVAYAIEQEHVREQKLEFLDDIQNLRDELSMAKISLSGVPQVTVKSSLDDVREVHRLLRSKITFRRYHEIGREIIVTIAQSLETIFNGKNSYFGVVPDLRGWHLSVSHKLKRMKYETSALVRNVFKNNNVSPFWQLMIELVPSAILHNTMRKEQSQMESNINPGLCEQAYHDLDEF